MTYDDRPDQAKRLEQARIARGFDSAHSAAKYFGWSYPSYAQHENGIRGINRASEKYAKAFRVSEAWLLTGEGPPPNNIKDSNADFIEEMKRLSEFSTDDDRDLVLRLMHSLIDAKVSK